MALMDCHYYSEVLGMACAMTVLIPESSTSSTPGSGRDGHRTLWLLHGLCDDHSTWLRRTSIERYAGEHGLAVIMPMVHRSFYADQHHGYRYFTHLTQELPEIARRLFPLSDDPANRFVAGLSMGGYGAFKWALTQPDRFAAAASLSGVLDLAAQGRNPEPWFANDLKLAFGDPAQIASTEADLLHLCDKLARKGITPPRLYACCGEEDFLLAGNQNFVRHARQRNIPLTWHADPAADHNWAYWDKAIERVVPWLLESV